MKYSELVSEIAANKEMPKVAVDGVLRALQETVTNAVTAGDKVSIPGFVTFTAVERPARDYRSPLDGSVIHSEETRVPKIKALKEFKDTVKESKG